MTRDHTHHHQAPVSAGAPVFKGPAMKTRHYRLAPVTALMFLGCILAANVVTTELGMIPVGFGLVATAGTYFAGATFILRDALQDVAGKRWTLAVIAAGAVLSFAVAAPFIALASAAAFALAELADLAVYTPLRKRGYIRAALASNIVGAIVDTIVFLWIAGFPILDAIAGQLVGKLAITLLAITAVAIYRTHRKQVAA